MRSPLATISTLSPDELDGKASGANRAGCDIGGITELDPAGTLKIDGKTGARDNKR